MKNYSIKKRYLIQQPKELVREILTNSPHYKKNLQQFYFQNDTEQHKKGVIEVCFENYIELEAFLNIFSEHILLDVTEDKRYKNRYLELFGLPETYDFSLLDVYKKCDKLGTKDVELVFAKGISSYKVISVLLYRNMQFLEHEVGLLLEDDAKAPKRLFKLAHTIVYLLKIANVLFDTTMLITLSKGFEPFLSRDREVLIKYASKDGYQKLLMDMHFFLCESSGFYLSSKSTLPIFFFVKKYLKKEKFRVAKSLKKALY